MKTTGLLKLCHWAFMLGALLGFHSLAAQSSFRLTQPTYLCSSGFIAFNTTGGDGTTITYSTTGVALSSPISNTGLVEAAYRTNPAIDQIVIEATQSGVVSRYVMDVPYYCARTFLYPGLRAPIPDATGTQGETLPLLNVGQFFRSRDFGYEYRATFSYKIYGLPSGLTVLTQRGKPPGTMGFDTAYAFITGTPTLAGNYPVAVIATNEGAFTESYSIADTFNLTVIGSSLPVTLVSFSARVLSSKRIELSWSTSLEKNNRGFLVERSKDLLYYEPVGEVSSHEFTKPPMEYTLTDSLPYMGFSYYRLTQIDQSGKRTTYPAISVVLRDTPYGILPNPVNQSRQFLLQLDEPNSASIALFSMDGREFSLLRMDTGANSVLIKIRGSVSAGMYFLTVKERGYSRQHRVLIE